MTASPSLSPRAQEFLRRHIGSILQLDIVLLLHADPARWWSVAQTAEELRIGQPFARQALEELGTTNLLDMRIGTDLTYRYAPWQPETAVLIEEIAHARYDARDFVAQRTATSAAKRFADAFRLRTRKSDG